MKRLIPIVLVFVFLLTGCNANLKEVFDAVSNKPTEEPTEILTEPLAEKSSIEGKVILVDAGHGIFEKARQEAVAPGSSETKNAFVSGTRGANQTEEQLNLSVALKLQAALEEKGAVVHMTRTTHECNMSNIDRAELGNEIGADISVKLHADGNNNSSVYGTSVLVPGGKYIKDEKVISESRKAAEIILDEFVLATGAVSRGISVRNDMTGFNWSKVPVLIIEMGFMTNPAEDKLMETEEYQEKMVEGIVKGLEKYFE